MRKLFVLAPVAACLLLVGQAALSQPSSASETVDYLDDTPRPDDSLYVMPARDSGTSMPFWKVEVKPQAISIPEAKYPEAARRAGIEGQAVVYALVDTNGSVADARILKTSGNASLDMAAVAAAMGATFKPATQRDKPVQVWVSIPFRFSLSSGKRTQPEKSAEIFVRDDGEGLPRIATEPLQARSLDSALADLAGMLTKSTPGESIPRLAVTPFEGLDGSIGDTGVYMAEVMEASLARSGRCKVIGRDAVAGLLRVDMATRAEVMDSAARGSLVRVFRLTDLIVGTFARMDGRLKVMARSVNPRTGLVGRTGEVWVVTEPRPPDIPRTPPPAVPQPPADGTRFEGEAMKVLRVTHGTAGSQGLGGYPRAWSGGTHLWWRNSKPGDWLELGFDVETTGTYLVKTQLTKACDYAIVQMYLDGHKLGEPIDLFHSWVEGKDPMSNRVAQTGPLGWGTHTLRRGEHKLGVRIVSANPKAVQSYMFGIDYLDLVEQGVSGGGKKTERDGAYPDTVIANIPTTDGHPQNLVCPRNTGRVYITGEYQDAVYVLRTSDNVIVDTLHIACGPTHIDCDADGKHVYVGSFDEYHPNAPDRLYSIRTSDNTVIDSVDLIDAPHGVACLPNGKYVYVALGNPTNKVAVVRTSDFSVVTNIPVGAEPCGIGALPNGQFVYVTCSYGNLVYVIRTSDNSVVRTIDAGGRVHRLAVRSDGDYVYVSRYEYGAPVMVIRTSDNSVVDSIPVSGGRACGLTALPGGRYVYVTNRDANSVEIIRTSDNTVVKTVGVGSTPYGAASLPDGSGVYVANRGNSVSFIGYRR